MAFGARHFPIGVDQQCDAWGRDVSSKRESQILPKGPLRKQEVFSAK